LFTQLQSCRRRGAWTRLLAVTGLLATLLAHGATTSQPGAREAESDAAPMIQLGPGDSISIQVYGQPDLAATVYVSDDGTVPVALVGPVQVAHLSPADAAQRIEAALRNARIINDPHVTITVTQSRSQRVSVLGEVGSPGRYAVDARMTIFDLLAQAGGTKETGSDVIYLVRTNRDGVSTRYPIDLSVLRQSNGSASMPTQVLEGGDVIFVPKAEEFYIYGEVNKPGMYHLDEKLTLEQAIVRAGGITAQGSTHRIEVKRRNGKGAETVTHMRLPDMVQPNDMIRVKESLF